jgi:hypothetical protein
MLPLLAPLFAQLVSLQLGNRTEARYVDINDTQRFEGSTASVVGLSVNARRTDVQLLYSPAITLSPLEKQPRTFYVYHLSSVSVAHRWRKTTAQLTSSFGIGSLNLQLYGLQGKAEAPGTTTTPGANTPVPGSTTTTPGGTTPTPGDTSANGGTTPTPGTTPNPTGPAQMPGGTPTTPGATSGVPVTKKPDTNQKVRFYTSTTTFTLGHQLAKDARLVGFAGVSQANSLDKGSQDFFPKLRSEFIGGNATYGYRVAKTDTLGGNLSLIKNWSSNGNEAATANAVAIWVHQFAPRTSGAVNAGINVTRFSQDDGLAGFSVFPTALLSVTHAARLAGGQLTFLASAFSSPALDPLRAIVDPRIGLLSSVGFTGKKVFVGASASTTVSVAPRDNDAGAVDSRQLEGRAGYRLGDSAAIDTGVRMTKQTYGGQTVIPTAWAGFVGVTLGHNFVLMGAH